MKYKAVIFDLDGTLLNTLDDLCVSINYALAKCGFPPRTKDEVRSFVGNGIRLLVRRAIPENATEADEDRVFREFHGHYAIHCADNTKPYDGACNMICALREKGVKIAIVSNKAHYAVAELADKFFPNLIDACAGEREGIKTKPAPDSVFEVLGQIGCDVSCSVYVGDADTDIDTAKNAGCDCISVTWGFRGRDFLISRGATTLTDSFDELYSLLTT